MSNFSIIPVFDDEYAPPVESGRPTGDLLISAVDNDVDAILEWIGKYRHSPHTFASARKEGERFYLWLQQRGLSLAAVKKADCEQYRDFLLNPQPAELWCGPTKPRFNGDGTVNSDWKPFVRPLKFSSAKQACTQIFGLYEFLSTAGYLRGNPWRLIAKIKNPADSEDEVERFLDTTAMNRLRAYIDSMASGNSFERKHYVRTRWIFSLLYLTAARRSEVVSGKMGDFKLIAGRWWWKVLGKGNKLGSIPLNEELMEELKKYRLTLNLPPLPQINETVPLVSDVSGKQQPISSSALYKIVKQIMENAAVFSKNMEDFESENSLLQASTHWMRHTSATDQTNAENASLVAVSKNLRHSNIATTSRYLHADRDKRHQQTKSHKMWEKDDDSPV